MTVATVALSALPETVDFTAGASATYDTNARKTSGGAIPAQGLWAGVTFNGQVKYTGSDNDRDIILQNIGGVVPPNVKVEQVP